MSFDEDEPKPPSSPVLLGRQLLTCCECGWVHYAMTAEEKAASDGVVERYQLSKAEQFIYESAFRQCLRCEAPTSGFRPAKEPDLAQAEGHLVTPVLVEAEMELH
jgi:hypothetical protein